MPRKKKKTRATASSLPMMNACANYESDNSGPMPHADFGTLFHNAIEKNDLEMLLTEESLQLGRLAGKTRAQTEAAFAWAGECIAELDNKYHIRGLEHEVNGQCSLLPGRNFYIDILASCDDGAKAVVLDWKTSRNLDNYQADSCEQGWLYVAAIFELADSVKEVDMIFAAPFAEDEEDKLSVFTYTRNDVEWLTGEIDQIVSDADDLDEPTACSYCTWCKHYKTCSETTSIIAPAMEDRFGEILDRAKNSPILMAKLRDCVPVLEQVVKDIKQTANDMYFEEGKVVPGYQAIETKGKTMVREPGKIVEDLVKKYDLKIPDLAEYLKIDVKSIETVVRNNVPRGKGAESVEEFRAKCFKAGWLDLSSGSVYLKKSKQKKEIDS